MLIRSFGEFWNPAIVDWPASELNGKFRRDGTTITTNAWEQHALYALYSDYRVVYVGKTSTLGTRIKKHLEDRHAGRWDSFSWFGYRKVLNTGHLRAAPGVRQISLENISSSFEALAIALTDAPLNRRHESIPNADLIEQIAADPARPIRGYLEEILEKLP